MNFLRSNKAAPSSLAGGEPDRRPSRAVRRARLALGLALGLVALGVIVDVTTASPSLCESCHEMGPRAAAWRESGHAAVTCVSCHEAPHAWYELPQRLVARGGLLGRDVYAHFTKEYPDPVDRRLPGVAPMADDICLQCHRADRKATSGYRILIDHPEHAKRNKSCVSCHLRTAHPEPLRGRALSLMAQCYTCHGDAKTPKASTACSVCHPSDFDLRPALHKNAKWKTRHGRVSAADQQQCAMCHTRSFCTDCHGLQMPHPAGWDKGRTGHAAFAQRDRAVCARCHKEKPDLCSMCHHKSYNVSQGTWLEQHPVQVREAGTTFCMQCHGPLFCTQCHTRWASEGP